MSTEEARARLAWRVRLRSLRDRRPQQPAQMTLVEHLTELRNRIIKTLIAVAARRRPRLHRLRPASRLPHRPVLRHPADKVGPQATCDLIITDPLDGVTTRFKVAAYLGLVLALPIVLYQLWRFITPGLHPKEKRYAIPFIISVARAVRARVAGSPCSPSPTRSTSSSRSAAPTSSRSSRRRSTSASSR